MVMQLAEPHVPDSLQSPRARQDSWRQNRRPHPGQAGAQAHLRCVPMVTRARLTRFFFPKCQRRLQQGAERHCGSPAVRVQEDVQGFQARHPRVRRLGVRAVRAVAHCARLSRGGEEGRQERAAGQEEVGLKTSFTKNIHPSQPACPRGLAKVASLLKPQIARADFSLVRARVVAQPREHFGVQQPRPRARRPPGQ